MPNYDPFNDRKEKKESNWFLKTATRAAAFTGTAFGMYSLWKFSGPARKILEKAVDDRIRRIVAEEAYRSGDKLNEILKGYSWGVQESSIDMWDAFQIKDANGKIIDADKAWDQIDTPTYTRNEIRKMEREIVRKMEEDASYAIGDDRSRRWAIGNKYDKQTWFAVNSFTDEFGNRISDIMPIKVSFEKFESEIVARVRQQALLEYYNTYGKIITEADVELESGELEILSDYFSTNEYLQVGRIEDGTGKKHIDRVSTIHDSLISDKRYADIYYRILKPIHRGYVLAKHSYQRPKVPKSVGTVPINKQFLYGNIVGHVFDEEEFKPQVKAIQETLVSVQNPHARIREVTSMGSQAWGPTNRFSVLQETVYTGHIENIRKELVNLVRAEELSQFEIKLVDYGSPRSPEKRLVLELYHKDLIRYQRPFRIEIPIGIDGRMPGATPGLQQINERFHIVGDNLGFNKGGFGIINTTERNLILVARMLKTSLTSGTKDSFKDDPIKAVKRINNQITQIIQENSASRGNFYDLIDAMSIDNPFFRDLIDSSRRRHNSAIRTTRNYIATANNIKQIAKIRKSGERAVIINIDLETLDNSSATPGKALLSKHTQIVKTGIVVQDASNGMIREAIERSNSTGLDYYDTVEKWEKGSGYNAKLIRWLNEGVLPEPVPAGQVRDEYKKLLDREKAAGNWLDAKNRTDVVRKTAAEIQKLKRQYEKDGYKVYIGTKNGYDFDLRPFEQEAQDFYREIIGSVIDAQAIGTFQNNALGENNALRLEQMIKTLMGRLGHDVEEFKPKGLYDLSRPYGVKNVFEALRKADFKVQNGNLTLINWKNSEDPFNLHGTNVNIKAHGSPRSDAGLGAALTMSIIGDYEAGRLNFLNDVDGVQNILHSVTSGPIDPNTWQGLFTYLNNKTLDGFGVASFSATSQGLVAKLIASTVHINELSPFADPLNLGTRRRLAGLPNIGLSKYYQRLAAGTKDPYRFARQFLGRFMTTNTVEDGSRIILDRYNIPKASDVKNQFATSVMANTLYVLEPTIEPYIALTEGFTKKFESKHYFSIYSDTVKGDHVFNAKIMDFYKAVQKELKDAKINNPTREQLDAIYQIVSKQKNWNIPLDSQIFSASSYGGSVKFPHRSINGRIVAVELDRERAGTGKTTVPRLIAKLEYTLNGFETFKSSQLQLPGSHAVSTKAEAISDAIAFGAFGKKSYDILASAEFIKKGHIGAIKEILLSQLLKELYDTIQTTKDRRLKSSSISLLKEIKRQLKAKVSFKHNQFIRDTKELGSTTDRAVKALGDIELRIGQITEWYKRAGLVWNKEEIKHYADLGYKGDVHKYYFNMYNDIVKDKSNSLLEKYEVLKGLTQEQRDYALEEMEALRDLFRWGDIDNPGIRLFIPVKFANSNHLMESIGLTSWKIGITAYQDLTIYNHDMELGRNQSYIFRHDYYLGLKHTYHGKNKTTMDFLARHTFASRNAQLRSFLATYKRFIDIAFAEKLTMKPMNINEINYLSDIKQKIELQSQKYGLKGTKTWGDMETGSLAAAKADREKLLNLEESMLDEETKKRLKSEITEIDNILAKRPGGTRLFDSISKFSKVYTAEERDIFDMLAKKNKGVLVFNLPTFKGNNVHVIDIEETMRRQLYEIMGKSSLSADEVKGLTTKLIHTLSDAADMSRKDAPLRFDKKTGKLHLGALIVDWDPTPGNMFEAVGPGVFRAKEHTQIKIDMLEALKEWQTIATKMNQSKDQLGDVDKSFFDAATDKFNRMFLRYMMVGMSAEKMSEFWKAGQYVQRGLYLMHKNIHNIHTNIIALESTKPGAFKKYESTIKLIKEATMDTVLIHEKQFRNFRYVDQETGHYINVARYLESKIDSNFDKIIKGKDYLPGGVFVRHPVPQSGYDGIRTGQYLVIPAPLAKMIGVDDNSFYANPVYTAAQGGDFDGDHFFLHLKELGVIYRLNTLKKADEMTRKDILNLRETQELLKESQIVDGKKVKIGKINSVLFQRGDKTWVSSLDMEGKTVIKSVKSEMLDLTSMINHSIDLFSSLAERAKAGDISTRRLNALMESQASILISKQMIPLTTNLLKTRVHEILSLNFNNISADFSKRFMMFVGNLNHGLSGMAQRVIEIGKHSYDAKKLADIYEWLQDPTKKREEARSAWFEMREEQMGKRYDLTLEKETWDLFSDQLANFKMAKRYSRDINTYNKQVIDFYEGRKGANILSFLRTWTEKQFEEFTPDSPRSVTEELSDALSKRIGRNIDVSPIFRKAGKYGAIGAAVFLGLSAFTPFGNSKSLNPIDMFIDLGHIDGDRSAISSPLELPRSVPLDMIDASFSKQVYIRLNNKNRNNKKDAASIVNKLLMGSILSRGDSIYEFEDKPYKNYSNYTTDINTIGSNELNRRANIL